MKIRLKKIKHLYFAYAVIKVLVIAVALFFVLYLYKQYVELNENIDIVTDEIINSFEYEQFSDNLFPQEFLVDEQLQEKQDSFINLIKISQNKIQEIADDNKVLGIYFLENTNSLLSDYDLLKTQKELLFSYKLNLGDLNTGLYSKMKKAEINFLSKIKVYDTKNIIANRFNILDQSIKLLLNNKSILLLENIKNQINEISNLIENMPSLPNDYMKVRIQDSYSYFKASFYELAKQVSIIGFGNNAGLVSEINLTHYRIEKRLEKLLNVIKARKEMVRRIIIITIIILIILSLAINILASQFFVGLIRKVFDELKKYTNSIKSGAEYKVVKEDYIEESHSLFDLLHEYEQQIVSSKKLMKSLVENKSLANIQDSNYSIFKSELIKFQNEIKSLHKQLKDETKKSKNISWINKGVNKITDVLRHRYDSKVLSSDELITILVNFLDIPIGALYMVDNNIITMQASFAYGEKKHYRKQVVFGEGIVGTAAAEKRSILITSIPEDYFEIISGFGYSKPKSILVSPIKLNENVYGIIELASLTKFKSEEIDFIEEVSKTIAYSFAISKTYSETLIKVDNMKIEMSQLKTEKGTLLNDYEELDDSYRNVSEQLQDSLLAMRGIDDVAMIVDLDLNGNLIKYNKSFEDFFTSMGIRSFNYNFKEYFTNINTSSNFDVELIWKNLKLGIKYSSNHNVKIFDKPYLLRSIFLPILDDNGTSIGIKTIIFDLTYKNT